MKTTLIDVGGGMRGVFGAGALDWFLEHGVSFDTCIGVSAGSANIASFLANQKGRNYRFYTEYVQDSRYMSVTNFLRDRNFFGLDYVYNVLTNDIDPIDYDSILNSSAKMQVVATRASDGKAVYFDQSDLSGHDCKILMASSAMPVVNMPVEINGEMYFDGGVADPVPVDKALSDGTDFIVAILTRPLKNPKKPENMKQIYKRALQKYPDIVDALDKRHEKYNSCVNKLLELERQGRAKIIAPEETAQVTMVSKTFFNLETLYNMGKREACNAFLQQY